MPAGRHWNCSNLPRAPPQCHQQTNSVLFTYRCNCWHNPLLGFSKRVYFTLMTILTKLLCKCQGKKNSTQSVHLFSLILWATSCSTTCSWYFFTQYSQGILQNGELPLSFLVHELGPFHTVSQFFRLTQSDPPVSSMEQQVPTEMCPLIHTIRSCLLKTNGCGSPNSSFCGWDQMAVGCKQTGGPFTSTTHRGVWALSVSALHKQSRHH